MVQVGTLNLPLIDYTGINLLAPRQDSALSSSPVHLTQSSSWMWCSRLWGPLLWFPVCMEQKLPISERIPCQHPSGTEEVWGGLGICMPVFQAHCWELGKTQVGGSKHLSFGHFFLLSWKLQYLVPIHFCSLVWCWELNLGVLQEQPMLLNHWTIFPAPCNTLTLC